MQNDHDTNGYLVKRWLELRTHRPSVNRFFNLRKAFLLIANKFSNLLILN